MKDSPPWATSNSRGICPQSQVLEAQTKEKDEVQGLHPWPKECHENLTVGSVL